MIIKINGAIAAASQPLPQPVIPSPGDFLWGAVEKGRDVATDAAAGASNEILIWFLDHMATFFKDFGHWLLQVGPDTAVLISMIFCLGAICSIPRCGKYAVWSMLAGVVIDIIRRGVGVA